MRVEEAVDERKDPIASTTAAARLLNENYQALGTWPLAITAYNHGADGIRRAIETVGSRDLAEIVRLYRGKAFGFASRNFYAEFLAALEVEKDHRQWFGDLSWRSPMKYKEILVDSYIPLTTLLRYTGLPKEGFLEFNPSLNQKVIQGSLHIPKGFRIKVPAESMEQALEGYNAIPNKARFSRQRGSAPPSRLARRPQRLAVKAIKAQGRGYSRIKTSANSARL
jgi:membrane-bound lytic murein transglycosylase D